MIPLLEFVQTGARTLVSPPRRWDGPWAATTQLCYTAMPASQQHSTEATRSWAL